MVSDLQSLALPKMFEPAMLPRTKRLLLRTSVLALAVNIIFLFAQFQKHGRLLPRDYLVASESLATTLVLLGALAFILTRIGKDKNVERS